MKASAEQLAKFLDGRASADERARILAELDADPELREVLSDTASVAGVTEVAERRGNLRAQAGETEQRRVVKRNSVWIAVAAGLVLAIGLRIARRPRDSGLPRVEVMTIALSNDAIPHDASTHPWAEFRGAPIPLSSRGRAIRIGALLADLDVRSRRRDTNAALSAGQIVALLTQYPGGNAVAAPYQTLMRTPTSPLPDARPLEAIAGEPAVRLGGWLELARYAAASRDSVFFASPDAASAIEIVTALSTHDPTVAGHVSDLRTALAAQPRDWARVSREIDGAIQSLAN